MPAWVSPESDRPRAAAVEAERLTLRLGGFAADLDGYGMGRTTLNGKLIHCIGFTVKAELDQPVRIDLSFYPVLPGRAEP